MGFKIANTKVRTVNAIDKIANVEIGDDGRLIAMH